MERQKRCAAYVRVSTSDQSTELQKAELLQFAAARGWSVEVFEDAGFSGKNVSRPALKRLLDAAARREFDICLVWKLDRFARSLSNLITMIEFLAELKIDFVSFKDNLDLSTSQGRLMLHMLGAFAQFERDLIVSRVKAGIANARRKGKRLGRPQRIDAREVLLMRSQGMSLSQIAKALGTTKGGVSKSLKKSATRQAADSATCGDDSEG